MTELELIFAQTEKKIRKKRFWCVIFCVIAVIVSWLTLTADWFQRSGAVMAIFAALTQYNANYITTLLEAPSLGSSAFNAMYKRNKNIPKYINWASLFLGITGTVIWGYGDHLWRLTKALA